MCHRKGVVPMSVHIQQVLDYLDDHRVCQTSDSIESLLGTIYDAYACCNCFETDETRKGLQGIHDLLDILPQRLHDEVLYRIFALCQSQETLAFSQGFLAGMLLMTEINCLP